MGLDDADLLDDVDGGCKSPSVSCSICLEAVTDNGDRSRAKLQCGHEFHLDCIGSAFNIKGAMQCPNCRKIERGQWLYASGYRPAPEFSMEDWATHDEDLYDLSFSEMSFGVHWCPFSGLTRLPSSFDEGEFPSTAYHDLIGQHAVYAEHTAMSSASNPCPYIAYFGPIHASSNSGGPVSDSPNFNGHWNGASVPNDMHTSFAFPSVDIHYPNWEHHSSPFPTASSRIGGSDQSSVPSVTQRAARANPEIPRPGSFMHPFLVGHSSAARAGSSVSSMIPPYPGSVARARDRVQALQAYFQQPSNSPPIRPPIISGARRSSSHRGGLAQLGPVASSSDQTGGFYFFPSGSSGRNYAETENPMSNHFHGWEREQIPSYQVDRDPVWGPFHQGAGGSDTTIRSASFRPRHGSERTPSQNRS